MDSKIIAAAHEDLNSIDASTMAKSNAIIFYSGLCTPDEIINIFKFKDSFQKVIYIDMEDLEDYDDESELPCKGPSLVGVEPIVEFINKNPEPDNFIVSCSAGISRTGAIVNYLLSKNCTFSSVSKTAVFGPNSQITKFLKELDPKFDGKLNPKLKH